MTIEITISVSTQPPAAPGTWHYDGSKWAFEPIDENGVRSQSRETGYTPAPQGHNPFIPAAKG